MLDIEIRSNHFRLHPSGAVLWLERRMLLISDVHLGKVSHFRKHGIALPQRSFEGNFRRLGEVADFFKANIICFLGDLFHSSLNREWRMFEDWVQGRPERMLLVEGNHDILDAGKYENAGMAVAAELRVDGFRFSHEPSRHEDLFTFCGHIHPGVRLSGKGRQSLSLRCFFRSRDQMILPAFGEFTGKYLLQPGEDDLVYALAADAVMPVNMRPI